MNVTDLVKNEISQHIGVTRPTNKGWLKRNCMMCHTRGHSMDKRGRFGIIFNHTGIIAVHCFNCGFSASFKPGTTMSNNFKLFLREIGMPDADIEKIDVQNKITFPVQSWNRVETSIELSSELEVRWPSASLPAEARTLEQLKKQGCKDNYFLDVFNYAKRRGISNLDDFYWSPETDLLINRRLLLPFTYDDHVVGYTGRYIYSDNNKVMKHYHCMPDNFIYNFDRISNYRYVILCEGVLDAYFINGVAIMGPNVNAHRANLLNDSGKNIIVCPDHDKSGKLLIEDALKYGWAVSYPDWGDDVKDVADAVLLYGRSVVLLSILQSVCHTETGINRLIKTHY